MKLTVKDLPIAVIILLKTKMIIKLILTCINVMRQLISVNEYLLTNAGDHDGWSNKQDGQLGNMIV